MRRAPLTLLAASVSISAVVLAYFRRQRRVQRIGMVIGMRPDHISEYEALHAVSNPGVRDLLVKFNMHDFSIFLKEIEPGKHYLFGYFEYTGSAYVGDMQKLAADPRNVEWLRTTDQLQIPLDGERSWSIMREVYH